MDLVIFMLCQFHDRMFAASVKYLMNTLITVYVHSPLHLICFKLARVGKGSP